MRKSRTALCMMVCTVLASSAMAFQPVSSEPRIQTVTIGSGELVQSVLMQGMVRYENEQPCVSLQQGRISRVCVKEGDAVRTGEVLFQLDSSAYEQALAVLYQKRHDYQQRMAQTDAAIAALAVQTEMEMMETEAQLLSNIEASSIRAQRDGIVEQVSAREGAFVQSTEILAMVRGDKKCIVAQTSQENAQRIKEGYSAVATIAGKSVVCNVDSIVSAENGYMVTFTAQDDGAVIDVGVNTLAQMEIVCSSEMCSALIPFEAVDENGNVWYAEHGRIYGEKPLYSAFNREYVAAGEEWTGRAVVLFPDRIKPEKGMRVRGSE